MKEGQSDLSSWASLRRRARPMMIRQDATNPS